ncbi:MULTISPECIES: DUF3592 domain-containing protein [unclassified Bradyrhizobium]|uniref:DUF3592 domain-containing protein n=1 Tax=unclassified Bradyrhizobium TaxID=2631580 RepID=UPI001BA5B9BE|nr:MULTISPECIES: DUF3592 domain-containing protein [unclassified Bradyrhizobium]MBR1205654.1 DUF3592 domain-containing protein [Bradyrhizobium sp. AUGA SZCCT0124]MBR1313897.1 DUF3592 domain-containing protein [Bradyrhizobium sp. AUGA SZCCT0051]MBR1337981.1 DUF3592 domain-containing protein [Bradyrhizobium sp. AUGA SZCCT0105]MBR1355636.1 DUF3592 domain-containing protein [Bradyrhizobium sp. AUGA SZCCT0045]
MLTQMGIAIICVTLYWRFADSFGERRRTAMAWGTVIDLPMRGLATRVPHPQIRFQTTDGQQVTFISNVGSNLALWPVGCQTRITYDPSDPQNADIKHSAGLKMLWLIGAIVATTVVLHVALNAIGVQFAH